MEHTFNRTTMELKLSELVDQGRITMTFNRTTMELKPDTATILKLSKENF